MSRSRSSLSALAIPNVASEEGIRDRDVDAQAGAGAGPGLVVDPLEGLPELNASGRISHSPSRHSRTHSQRPSISHSRRATQQPQTQPTDMTLIQVNNIPQAASSSASAATDGPSPKPSSGSASSSDSGSGSDLVSRFDALCSWSSLTCVDMLTSGLVSSSTLLIFRSIVSIWLLSMALAIGIVKDKPFDNGIYMVQTLSYLHFCLTALYFTGMVVLTYQNRMLYRQCVSYQPSLVRSVDYPLSRFGRVLWVVYELVAVCTILVTIIFWSLLYQGDFTWDTFHLHAAQSIAMCTESVLNRLMFVSFHVVFLLAIGTAYLIFAIIVRYAQGAWIYPFLDYDSNRVFSPLMYPGMLLLVVLVFFVYSWLIKQRNKYVAQYHAKRMQQSDIHAHLNSSKRGQSYAGLSASSSFDPFPSPSEQAMSMSKSDQARLANGTGGNSKGQDIELGLLSCLRTKNKAQDERPHTGDAQRQGQGQGQGQGPNTAGMSQA